MKSSSHSTQSSLLVPRAQTSREHHMHAKIDLWPRITAVDHCSPRVFNQLANGHTQYHITTIPHRSWTRHTLQLTATNLAFFSFARDPVGMEGGSRPTFFIWGLLESSTLEGFALRACPVFTTNGIISLGTSSVHRTTNLRFAARITCASMRRFSSASCGNQSMCFCHTVRLPLVTI